mmetsp:Transcript_17628/g.48765  ORF Transcript_17628/g.48765 Transcript_17628/m.48765 type:complete len:793 (-) Transcript_17628:419-2797(-)
MKITSTKQSQIVPLVIVTALTTIGILLSIASVDGLQPSPSATKAYARPNICRRVSLRSTGRRPYSLSLSLSSSSPRCFQTQLFDSQSPSESREEEIRKKIEKLKEEGRIANNKSEASPDGLREKKKSAYDDYAEKVQGKLGKRRGQVLGFTGDGTKNWNKSTKDGAEKEYDIDDFIAEEKELDAEETEFESGLGDNREEDERGRQVGKVDARGRRVGKIGTLPEDSLPSKDTETTVSSSSSSSSGNDNTQKKISINSSLFDLPDTDPEPPEMTEEELVELVAEKLAAKRAAEDAEIEAAAAARREEARKAKEEEGKSDATAASEEEQSSSGTEKTTTGVGGSWTGDEDEPEADYTPKVGGWGVFARPKSISEAYGGGRRIGAGYDKVDSEGDKLKTQKLLKDYRKKVGIEVPTEKEHAAEIEEALSIGQRAMQRGVYATAVSALEKVTIWCSTNSKVGSKIYLELAMAYEAVGRTKEAGQIYKTLSECRMEDVKYNAKRLLYGLEAMEVMRDVSSDFTRKKTRNTFIDATGLDNFASNFDDVYQTAYVDLEGGFYKKLTESVVRSVREARQILIQAQGKGEVSRTRIVQALRCINRNFEELLQSEIDSSTVREPTAFLNGKPIETETASSGKQISAIGDFQLLSAEEMIQNMDGEWKLQLLADKSGDGVSFFNTTTAVQRFSIEDMTFSAEGPSGLTTERCSGKIEMDASKRLLSRPELTSSNTGVSGILSMIGGGKNSGFSAAISRQQQIVCVDSLFLITRRARASRSSGDLDKEYFGVWRRVLPEQNDIE